MPTLAAMSAVRWVPVVAATAVTEPPWPCHDVEGTPVRLVRAPDGAIHAIGPTCPHQDSPLDRAEVEGPLVLCPRHYYAYDLATGSNEHPGWDRDEPLPVHPVRVVDGVVEVGLDATA